MDFIANEVLAIVATVLTALLAYVNSKYRLVDVITSGIQVGKGLIRLIEGFDLSDEKKELLAHAVLLLEVIEDSLMDEKLSRQELKEIFECLEEFYNLITDVVESDEELEKLISKVVN